MPPRTRYTEEFKRRVAARVTTDGIAQRLVAEEFNILLNNVFRWCHDPRFLPSHHQPQPHIPPPQPHLPRGVCFISNYIGVQDNERIKIGGMNVVCQHCSAKLFPGERKGFCCVNGKVVLPQQNEINGVLEDLLLRIYLIHLI